MEGKTRQRRRGLTVVVRSNLKFQEQWVDDGSFRNYTVKKKKSRDERWGERLLMNFVSDQHYLFPYIFFKSKLWNSKFHAVVWIRLVWTEAYWITNSLQYSNLTKSKSNCMVNNHTWGSEVLVPLALQWTMFIEHFLYLLLEALDLKPSWKITENICKTFSFLWIPLLLLWNLHYANYVELKTTDRNSTY